MNNPLMPNSSLLLEGAAQTRLISDWLADYGLWGSASLSTNGFNLRCRWSLGQQIIICCSGDYFVVGQGLEKLQVDSCLLMAPCAICLRCRDGGWLGNTIWCRSDTMERLNLRKTSSWELTCENTDSQAVILLPMTLACLTWYLSLRHVSVWLMRRFGAKEYNGFAEHNSRYIAAHETRMAS